MCKINVAVTVNLMCASLKFKQKTDLNERTEPQICFPQYSADKLMIISIVACYIYKQDFKKKINIK